MWHCVLSTYFKAVFISINQVPARTLYAKAKRQRSPFSNYILKFLIVRSGVNPDLCPSKDSLSETCHCRFPLTQKKNKKQKTSAVLSDSVLRISFGQIHAAFPFYIFASHWHNICLSPYNLTRGLSMKIASCMFCFFFFPPPLILTLISFFCVCVFKLLQTRLGYLFGSTWFNHKCKARMLLETEDFQM